MYNVRVRVYMCVRLDACVSRKNYFKPKRVVALMMNITLDVGVYAHEQVGSNARFARSHGEFFSN